MGSMTGMDAARKLREARDTAALIFISSSDSFAVESYDVQASYYLLKPFDPEKLVPDPLNNPVQAVAEFQIYRADLRPYPCKDSGQAASYTWIPTAMPVQVHTTDAGIIRSYITFQKFEELLEGMKCFLSCYRGCIVNMDHIEKSTDEGFVMDNQELVTVRKRGSNAIKKAYLEYLFSSDSDK